MGDFREVSNDVFPVNLALIKFDIHFYGNKYFHHILDILREHDVPTEMAIKPAGELEYIEPEDFNLLAHQEVPPQLAWPTAPFSVTGSNPTLDVYTVKNKFI